jgi:hypothetical protein
MSYFGSRIAVALLTFTTGVVAVTLWLLYRPAPTHEPGVAPRVASLPTDTPPTDAPPSTERAHLCEWQQRAGQALPHLYREYEGFEKRPTIERLVALDAEIRQLFDSRPEYYPCGDDTKLWEDKYAKLGVELDYWSLLAYSGKLLADAHRMNPKSESRRYTLFSTVEPEHGLGVMPNVKAAYSYAREFPDGPFREATLLLIADFHKDLYMVLRDDLRDYKYDCFKPYIDGSSQVTQARRARATAVSYYEKVIRANPTNARAKEHLEEVKKGTIRGWSFCAD